MKKILFAFLLSSTIATAQTDLKEKFEAFKAEMEAYRDKPEIASENSLVKPAPCGQYTLQYMVTGQGFNEAIATPPPRKLCADLNRFDKSKNPNQGDWQYEIKPIGDRYYVIRGDKKGSAGVQEHYYYERKVKK